jgi:hypothetical protein
MLFANNLVCGIVCATFYFRVKVFNLPRKRYCNTRFCLNIFYKNLITHRVMKKIVLLLLVVAVGLPAAIAQKFDFNIDSRYSDLNSISKRKLAVELLEEDGRAIAKLNKLKKDFPKAVEYYQAFVKSYNENMKLALAKYWKLNTEIEYKTPKEVKKLVDGRDKDYAILSAIEMGGDEAYITRLHGTAVALRLYRPDKSDLTDYKTVLPYAFSRRNECNVLTDYYFTIQFAAANIQHMLDKKVTSIMTDFMETQSINNCKLLKDKHLLLEKDLIPKDFDKKKVKDYYKKKFEVLKDETMVQTAIDGTDESKCYTVLLPFMVYKNPFDRNQRSYVICYKLIVNASDGVVLNFMEGKAKSGDEMELLQEKDFKDLDSCDK